jgi:DNA-directed RNA polymerase subunit omega
MDNIFLPIESDFVNTQSRFRLAILAGQRAKQIIEGDNPTLQSKYTKATTIAIEEILEGDLKIFYGKEAVRHIEDAARVRKERKSQYLSPEREEELKKEIKKDLNVYLAEKESSLKEETSKDMEIN